MLPMTSQIQAKSITLAGVGKTFGATVAVHPTDLEVAQGEFLTLLGPSGCGKTTILRMIAGLESTSTGRILLDEADVTGLSPRHRDVAIMFQDYALFPHMSVVNNVAYGLKMRGQPAVARRKSALDWLERFGLLAQAERKPAALSGGQRQRVALARALITQPGALLLDEPLSALDANLRTQLRAELRRIHREVGTTFICVTHDQEEAMTLSDRIVVFRDGRVEQVGPPDTLYDTPATAFVAQFLGRCILWPATLNGAGTARVTANGMQVQPTGDVAGNSRVCLVVRPETFALCAEDAGDLTGSVVDVIPKGPVVEIAVTLDCGSEVMLDLNRHPGPVPVSGQRTGLRLQTPKIAAVPVKD